MDPERASLVRWALEEYATGEWSISQLMDALTARGLRTRGSKRFPSKPISIQTLNRILRNPYYFGVMPYRGVFYEGKHDALITAETWLHIQDVLASHKVSGEKTRKHPHYLKGTIWCGGCGSRLVYSRNRGRGGVYEYFFCVRRKTKRGVCSRSAVRVDKIEAAIASFYNRFKLRPSYVEAIRAAILHEASAQQADAAETETRAVKQLQAVKDERATLLQAHYAGAIPQDLLKTEMDRFTRELAAAERELGTARASLLDLELTLTRALTVAGVCDQQYRLATPRIRRQINQGLFEKLYIGIEGEVEHYELTEPFAQLLDATSPASTLSIPTQRATEAPANRAASSAIFAAQIQKTTAGDDLSDGGLHNGLLVPPMGFEPTLPA